MKYSSIGVKLRTGDVLSILFDVDDFTWFYFTYDRGALSSLSSSQEYNDVIESIKEKDRKIAAEDKKPAYLYELSNDENIQRFRRRISSSSSNPDDEQ